MDYIDESEVLTPADEQVSFIVLPFYRILKLVTIFQHHIVKHPFTVPFVCGATDLGEALRRISEGAGMIRTKGEAGTGNIVEVRRFLCTSLTYETKYIHGSSRLFAMPVLSTPLSSAHLPCRTRSCTPMLRNCRFLTIF